MKDAKAISAVIGVIAGIASALLLAGAHQPSTFSLILIAAASLPVLIAGLGWSNIASITAVVSACLVISVTTGPLAALSAGLTSLAPAAWIAHLNNLARPATEIGGPEGRAAWYPLSDILFHISALMTVALIVLGFLVGYGPELAGQMVDTIIKLFNEQEPSINITADTIAQMKAILVNLLPVLQGAMWVGILFGMYALARSIVRLSGRSKRPADDFAAQLRMPRTGLWVFAAGIAITFLPGPFNLVGWALIGTFGGGFILTGFALMHFTTRGKSWRFFVLWLAYFSVILFTLPLLLFLAYGLSSTGRLSTMTPNDPKS